MDDSLAGLGHWVNPFQLKAPKGMSSPASDLDSAKSSSSTPTLQRLGYALV